MKYFSSYCFTDNSHRTFVSLHRLYIVASDIPGFHSSLNLLLHILLVRSGLRIRSPQLNSTKQMQLRNYQSMPSSFTIFGLLLNIIKNKIHYTIHYTTIKIITWYILAFQGFCDLYHQRAMIYHKKESVGHHQFGYDLQTICFNKNLDEKTLNARIILLRPVHFFH